jgi:type II secretory ATPase GspE/PulE/Tfp pilus assembly ATPase PilB-like protein
MVNLGISRLDATDPVIISGLISQRLVKTLCKCKLPFNKGWDSYKSDRKNPVADKLLMSKVFDLSKIYLRNTNGCDACDKTGISGVTVVAEVIVTDPKLMNLLRSNDYDGANRYWKSSLNGMTIIEHAIQKVTSGQLDPFDAQKAVGSFIDAGEISLSGQGSLYVA